MSTEIRRNRHSVSKLLIHLVLVVKYRRKAITDNIWKTLLQSFEASATQLDVRLVECNHERDHAHLVIEYPPNISVSKIVGRLKGRSAFDARRWHRTELQKKLWGGAFWTPSYFAVSCGGAPLDVLRLYVQNQQLNTALKDGVSTQEF